MRKTFGSLACATALIGLVHATSAFAAGGFALTSSSFEDNEIMRRELAAKGGPRECDGENISPAMSWTNAPAAAKSFAIVAHDQVGRHGLGVDHWVLYDIPANVSGFGEGEIPAGAKQGKNITGRSAYLGPCPDVGDVPHHYEFVIMALDLEPGVLGDDLTMAEFFEAVAEHSIGASSIVGRYARAH